MKAHLKQINETYFEHMRFAQKCGWKMIMAGLACVVHSFIPSIFVSTASDSLKMLDQKMTERKKKSQITT